MELGRQNDVLMVPQNFSMVACQQTREKGQLGDLRALWNISAYKHTGGAGEII